MPGLILSKLTPGIVARCFSLFPQGVLVVTGSAGKSTTTKMLVAIARAHGLKVFTNSSTANIAQGFYSSIIERSSLIGRIDGDVAILEMDEGHAAEMTKFFSPRLVTVLNVLDDQLDRFIDPAFVRDKLAEVASRATDALVMNADDQNILLIQDQISSSKISWFGVAPNLIEASTSGLGSAPTYVTELPRPACQTQIEAQEEAKIFAQVDGHSITFSLPNRGLHYALDAAAALESARRFLGERFDSALAAKTLDELPPVFARGEVTEVNGVEVEFILVQNPTSFQLNLDNLPKNQEQVMLAIGRDVHDPSWLWTVDFKGFPKVDILTGFNHAEMELRLAYEEIEVAAVVPNLQEAIDRFFAMPAPVSGRRTVIFSADSMRRIRRSLGFTDPDEVSR